MKKYFVVSFCHNGVLGGGLIVDDESITYKTGKVTVEPWVRDFHLEKDQMERIEWKWVIFPKATFYMKDGSKYSFLIFNKWRFQKVFVL